MEVLGDGEVLLSTLPVARCLRMGSPMGRLLGMPKVLGACKNLSRMEATIPLSGCCFHCGKTTADESIL